MYEYMKNKLKSGLLPPDHFTILYKKCKGTKVQRSCIDKLIVTVTGRRWQLRWKMKRKAL